MAKKKKKKLGDNNRNNKSYQLKKSEQHHRLHPDTKKSIWAVVFIGISIILILARFQNAGPLGNFIYGIFDKLFGWGYYLLPLIFLVLAGVFLTSERRKIYQITFIGAILFVLSGLGLIDIIFPDKGGIIGYAVGFLEAPFGYTASIIVATILLIISFLITLNLPIKIKRPQKFKEDDEDSAEIEKKEMIISEVSVAGMTVEAKESAESKQETKTDEIESKIQEGPAGPFKKAKIITPKSFKNYVAPPLSLLKSSVEKPTSGDLRANANIIKRTLESFGIPVEMGEINIGPKVTRYTLKPAEGVKLSRILALNQDLAMALAAHPIRIEAPIPGKALVGIEVPNKASALVRLGSLMAYPEFSSLGLISFVLGRDVSGEPLFADIEKMPHLLIAGSTGSGKSIMIHSLLISLLYKNSPDTMRLILIDPKRVELSIYNNIPHLVSPVITEPKKALAVFRWAISEMDRRYELLLGSGSRDVQSYNKKYPEEPLPYVLIVVDELADLMFSYGRDIEGSVVRLAQMARATGLHLILSTQRPSVEVVTGLIKANITSRIALQLPSQVDSRTVLDSSGAEKLLGGGDMLFISSESSKPKRIQGAYISEEEVMKVADFIRDNNKDLISREEEDGLSFENGTAAISSISDDILNDYSDKEEDELFEDAIKVVREAKKASASLLQRRLKVGYARAARLLDIMEIKGIVGPGDGAKPRDVYMENE